MPRNVGAFLKDHWPVASGIIIAAAGYGGLMMQVSALVEAQRTEAAARAVGQVAIIGKLDRVAEDVAGLKVAGAFASENFAEIRRRLEHVEARR